MFRLACNRESPQYRLKTRETEENLGIYVAYKKAKVRKQWKSRTRKGEFNEYGGDKGTWGGD